MFPVSRFCIKRIQVQSAAISLTAYRMNSLYTMKEEVTEKSIGSSPISLDEMPVLPPIIVGKNDKKTSSSKVQVTPEIEKKYVHRVYDAIAPHFSSTRFAKWPKVQTFLNSLASGSLIIDAGCGNGKYLGLNPNCYFIGCDISAPLINICSDKGHEVVVADAVNLPYRTGYGDAAISIAVLHHLSSERRRIKAVEELIRVVKARGLVLITVWAREQEDDSLVNKWTPLTKKYLEEWKGLGSPHTRAAASPTSLKTIPETEEIISEETSIRSQEWVGPSSPHTRAASSLPSLKSIPETEECISQDSSRRSLEWVGSGSPRARASSSAVSLQSILETEESIFEESSGSHDNGEHFSSDTTDKRASVYQQEFFVPWHLPYHRAEVSGISASAVANGFARKDDKKGAVVYDRYYHVFGEGELERLVRNVDGAIIVDKFYDKSNWCIILEKTS